MRQKIIINDTKSYKARQAGFAFVPFFIAATAAAIVTSVVFGTNNPISRWVGTAGPTAINQSITQQSRTGAPSTTQAGNTNICPTGFYRLGVPLGTTEVPCSEQALTVYVLGLYRYILGLAVVLAAIINTYAGYLYLTSGGDPAKQTHARELIIGTLSGLALLIIAATVLRFIGIGNP